MSRKVRTLLALLMLTLFLGTGAAHALPAESRSPDRAPGMLAAIWDWVISLLEVEVSFRPAHETAIELPTPPGTNGTSSTPGEGGGSIDPNGRS